jgi:hypothetical protein
MELHIHRLDLMTPEFELLKIALKDRYLIDRELGVGSMATVFHEEFLKHNRQVAKLDVLYHPTNNNIHEFPRLQLSAKRQVRLNRQIGYHLETLSGMWILRSAY